MTMTMLVDELITLERIAKARTRLQHRCAADLARIRGEQREIEALAKSSDEFAKAVFNPTACYYSAKSDSWTVQGDAWCLRLLLDDGVVGTEHERNLAVDAWSRYRTEVRAALEASVAALGGDADAFAE